MLESVKQYLKARRPVFLPDEKIEDWDRELVIKAISKLNTVMPITTLKSMRINRTPLRDPVLTEFVGKACSRKFLHHAGLHFFGSWNSALKASGLQPIKPTHNKFWSKALIIKSIQKLRDEGHPLTVLSIWRDRSRKTSKHLCQVTGKGTTASALHDAARRYFGSWDSALESSGISVESVKEKPFWTKNKIVTSLKILQENGVPLSSGKMEHEYRRAVSSMIRQGIGKKRSGKSLLGGAYRIFGSWDRALIEAGINPQIYRKTRMGLNIRQVKRVLNVLYHMKIPVNASSLARDCSDQTKSIIFDFTGQRAPGHLLYKFGNRKFGSWDAALKYSGFFLSEVRRNGSPCERNPEKVIEMIRMFHKNEIALNRSSMVRHSHHLKFFVEEHFGPAVSGCSLLGAAQELFGSWDQALWESGLDTSAIRLKAKPGASSLAVIPHQVEDIKRDGEVGLVTYLGNPALSPEEFLESRESANTLQDAVAMMDESERELAERIFDAVLQIHHYKDQDQLIKFITENLDNEIPETTVRNIFSKLAFNMGAEHS